MRRRVYRSWAWTVIGAIGMGLFVLIGVSGFTVGDVSDPFSVVLCSVCALGGLIGLYLALRMGIVIDQAGIRHRAFGRGSFLPWEQVISVSCDAYDERLGRALYAPIVQVAQPQQGSESGYVSLAALGSYRRAVADRRTKLIAAYLAQRIA
jgi:hypothetical protein